ncbi:hypothetical protein SAMN04488511_101166 [Pedobacter suwonensis]|uniref:Uncharacterized protein n=1 Tax=Pedobacter suwonensis TaxID=332999 RepID=A0A1I0SFL7_9SPHI|nr:hypothetical protein [Pedobacter suwonensis]SFA38288.1 hypothetical protein SAMN04488511_101166 [Pedobacter suwonensis]
MIKIQIADREGFRQQYLAMIHPSVIIRLKYLRTSLAHLLDPDSIQLDEIVPVKSFTKAIVDSSVKPARAAGAFNKNKYIETLKLYQEGATEIIHVDFVKLTNLIDHLLIEESESLRNLLIGEPLDIKGIHDQLFETFEIATKHEKDVMYLAFSYEDLGTEVRTYFYDQAISLYCAYCNISKANHRKNPKSGRIIDQYQLDHFFSQTDHPMLALSLFNLVPSDYVCNVPNKGKILFSDEFHLNPYVSGFKRDMVFKPLFDELGVHLEAIDLKIMVDRDSHKWKQFIGDADERDLAPDHGNINVFQLYGKYNDRDLLWEVNHLYNTYVSAAKNARSIQDILDIIEEGQNDRYLNIKIWYEQTSRKHFHEKDFGRLPHSKLYRDLLDHAFGVYAESLGEEVTGILEESYQTERGGE